MSKVIIAIMVCFIVAMSVQVTVKDRYVVGGDTYSTVVVEGMDGTYYYNGFYYLLGKGMTDECKVFANQMKPGTTHEIGIDSMYNILSYD